MEKNLTLKSIKHVAVKAAFFSRKFLETAYKMCSKERTIYT